MKGYWEYFINSELQKPYLKKLIEELEVERETKTIWPLDEIFRAYCETPFEQVRVVILGQDPYPTNGHSDGLAFSSKNKVNLPPSLRMIKKELLRAYGTDNPKQGSLESWAKQGVFLLNSILTVEDKKPNSHRGRGWEIFTDTTISALNSINDRKLIFLLWGREAQKKVELIQGNGHIVLKNGHPSPANALSDFYGSDCFVKVNYFLKARKEPEIDWILK